jgi:membrane protein
LVALVVWIYYSAQILFMGAEFAQVYAARYGSRIVPTDNAVPINAEDGKAGSKASSEPAERRSPRT